MKLPEKVYLDFLIYESVSPKCWKVYEEGGHNEVEDVPYVPASEAEALRERVKQLEKALPQDWDCGSNSCRFAKNKGGMRTNGPCSCIRHMQTPERLAFITMHTAIKSVLEALGGGEEK